MGALPPYLFTLMSAELFFFLLRANDLKILVKQDRQRTLQEQARVTRGLRRSLLLECLLFVPASAVLLLLLVPLVAPVVPSARLRAFHALLGLVSYGFPFGAVRGIVTRVAVNALREIVRSVGPAGKDENV